MAAFQKFDQFVEDLAHGVHRLDRDRLKVFLTDTTPLPGHRVKADLVEVEDGNGYETGGRVATVERSGQVNGLYTLILNSPDIWEADGDSIGPFRYPVLYNDTATSDPLIGWWDRGESVTLQDGDRFEFLLDPDGVVSLTV